jgi:hypothetical protein
MNKAQLSAEEIIMKYSLSFKSELQGKLLSYDGYQLGYLFMEYFNDYLTIDRFAEDKNLTRYEASRILDIGKKAFNDKEFFNSNN